VAQTRDRELGRQIVDRCKRAITERQTPEALKALRDFLDARQGSGDSGRPRKSPGERLVDQIRLNLIERVEELLRYWNKHLPRHKKSVAEIEKYLERKNFPALPPGALFEIHHEMGFNLGGQGLALTLKPAGFPLLRHRVAVQLSDYRTLKSSVQMATATGHRGRGGSLKLRAAIIGVEMTGKRLGPGDPHILARQLLEALKKRPLSA
jgi:hypothetical protein